MNNDEPLTESPAPGFPPLGSEPDPEAAISRMSRRALLWSAGAIAGTYGAWRWLASRPLADGLPKPIRSVLEFNESVWGGLSSNSRLSPEFPKAMAKEPRVNGRIGFKETPPKEMGDDRSTLLLGGLGDPAEFSLGAVLSMPARDVVTELRCIEGWSQVVHWRGVSLAWLIEAEFGKAGRAMKYVSAQTPDGEYFVALDMAAALHPQTLLCYEMNGKPLTPDHGAPLRLVVPVKYGIKSLKRVAKIELTNELPPDYWRERGYDGYVGL